jgi:hypothetical protein
LLIVLTLPLSYRCSLDRLQALRLLPPRSGLERSDFVLWPDSAVAGICSEQQLSGDKLPLMPMEYHGRI